MSKERPILFSGPMIRALLDGSKTQTRRVIKRSKRQPFDFVGGAGDLNDPSCWGWEHDCGYTLLKSDGEPDTYELPCHYGQPGDRLWVREAHHRTTDGGPVLLGYQESGENREFEQFGVHVREFRHHFGGWGGRSSKNFPSIHMPRWASRILLEIVSVRVERLQDISHEDAEAEGVKCNMSARTFRDQYRELWERINGPGSWDANPWVWVISVRRITP